MGNKWNTIKLKDITTKITKGSTPTANDGGFTIEGINFIKAESVDYSGNIDTTKFVYISEEINEKYKRSQLAENDILFSMAGAFLGKSGFVEKIHLPANTNQALALIRIDTFKAYPKFVHYVLQHPSITHFVNNSISQSAQPNINLQQIGDLDIFFPPLSIQQEVADFLLTIDNKITLNRQINQTLEQMAQTLFKSWFVDFDPVIDNALDVGNEIPEPLQARAEMRQKIRASQDFQLLPADVRALFPAEFEESELGCVPKGWEISTAGDEFVIKGGSTPSTAIPEFWDGTIHWTSPKDLSSNETKILLDTSRKITNAGLNKISSGLLPINTVLMSSRAPVGYLALAKVPLAINQGYIAIPSAKTLSSEYTIHWLESAMDEIKGMAGGTTFAEISKSTFKTINLIIPTLNVVNEFTGIVQSKYSLITNNVQEISLLTQLRDTLLPKLISGELRLDEITSP